MALLSILFSGLPHERKTAGNESKHAIEALTNIVKDNISSIKKDNEKRRKKFSNSIAKLVQNFRMLKT